MRYFPKGVEIKKAEEHEFFEKMIIEVTLQEAVNKFLGDEKVEVKVKKEFIVEIN